MSKIGQLSRPNGKSTRFGKMTAKCKELGIPISNYKKVMKARIESFERYGNLDNHVDPIMKSKVQKRREKWEAEQDRQARLKVIDLYSPLGQSRLVLRANGLLTTRDGNGMDLDTPTLIENQGEDTEDEGDDDMDSSDDSSDEDETDADVLSEANPNSTESLGTETYRVDNFVLQSFPLNRSSATKTLQNESRLQFEYQTEQAHNCGDGLENSNTCDQQLAPIKSSASQWHKIALYNLKKPKKDTYLRSVAVEKKCIDVCDFIEDELLHESPPNKRQSFKDPVSQQPPPGFKAVNMSQQDSSNIDDSGIKENFRSNENSSISHLLIKPQKPQNQIPVLTKLELAHICNVLKLKATGKESKLRNRIQDYQFQTKTSVNFSEILKTELPRLRDPENTSQSLNSTVPQQPIQMIDALLMSQLVSSEQHAAAIKDKSRSSYPSSSISPIKAEETGQVKLSDLTIFELQHICTSLGLKKNGQTAKLISRIQNYEKNSLKRPANLFKILKTLPRATEPENMSQPPIDPISRKSPVGFLESDKLTNTGRDERKITDSSIAELVHICLVLDLSTSGKKQILAKRIKDYEERLGTQLDLSNILNIKVRLRRPRRKISSATESQSATAPVFQQPLPAFESLKLNQPNVSEQNYYAQADTHENKGYGGGNSFEEIRNVSWMETKQIEPKQMAANTPHSSWQSPTYIEIGNDAGTTNSAPTQIENVEFIVNKCGHLADHEVVHLCKLYGLDTGGCHKTRARQLEDFQRLNKRLINFDVALKYLPTPGQSQFLSQKLLPKKLPCKRCQEMNMQCNGQLPCKNCADQGFRGYSCVSGDPQDEEEQAGAGVVEVQGNTKQFISNMHDQGFDDDMECEN